MQPLDPFEDAFSPEPSAPQRRAAPAAAAEPLTTRQVSDSPIIIDPAVAQASKPVAQVVSKHPPSVALSFGELLRRSLSLRPR
jgi:hypothetical protein